VYDSPQSGVWVYAGIDWVSYALPRKYAMSETGLSGANVNTVQITAAYMSTSSVKSTGYPSDGNGEPTVEMVSVYKPMSAGLVEVILILFPTRLMVAVPAVLDVDMVYVIPHAFGPPSLMDIVSS